MNKFNTVKSLFLFFVYSVFLLSCSGSKNASDSDYVKMAASFTDPAWDGISIPTRGLCMQLGGIGYSPEILVQNIPEDAEYLSATFRNRNNGNPHGIIEVEIDNIDEVIIPSVRQGTGGYLGPCFTGQNHRYEVIIKAEGTNSTVRLLLGRI